MALDRPVAGGRRKPKRLLLLFFMPAMALCAQRVCADDWRLELDPDWIGLRLGVRYAGADLFPEVDTLVTARIGASYDTFGYFRTPADGPYERDLPGYDAESPFFSRATACFTLGIDQGLLWNARAMHNLLQVFLAAGLRYERNLKDGGRRQILFDSRLPGRDESLQSSVTVGLELDNLGADHPHRLLSGMKAEASVEWGPAFLGNQAVGRSDFVRLNATASFFLPLFDVAPGAPANVLSAYLGAFAAVDCALGESIPLSVRQTFGGRSPRKGLGYAVRGLEDCRFDTPLKVVANLEMRAHLPALGLLDLIPGILVFFDGGYYDYLDFPEAGLVFSTGTGLYLSLFDMLSITVYTRLLLNERRVDDESRMSIAAAFVSHF